MNIYNDIINKKTNISVIGLGYVGMPIAVSFAKKINVIGFDINSEKIELYRSGIDPTLEVGNATIKQTTVKFTSNEEDLKKSKFHIIAVPTPITQNKTPDLGPVIGASKVVGKNLTKGSIVVYESTVYPGATEDICIPILEKTSGLKFGKDFNVGYSPERINPGDKIHTLEKIVKIVSGNTKQVMEEIAKVYEIVIDAGVYKASSIKVAEAAKVVENSQRDINIAFMNELAIVFDKMGISSKDVVDAMNTKWNALNFHPGLVGGHCIGVDPYYFISEAEKLGYHSQIISAGRKINDDMGEFIADSVIKELILANKKVKNSRVGILGFTFKENCPDTRNTKVIDIIKKLKDFDIECVVTDAYADSNEARDEYGIELTPLNKIKEIDCLIIAVKHEEYTKISYSKLEEMFIKESNTQNVIIDVKSILDKNELDLNRNRYWTL